MLSLLEQYEAVRVYLLDQLPLLLNEIVTDDI
jgi:hypothetical protein